MKGASPLRRVNRAKIDGLLASRGASQADLARRLGIPESAVSNLLAGKRAIKDVELPAMAGFLGIELVALLCLLGIDLQDAEAA